MLPLEGPAGEEAPGSDGKQYSASDAARQVVDCPRSTSAAHVRIGLYWLFRHRGRRRSQEWVRMFGDYGAELPDLRTGENAAFFSPENPRDLPPC